MVHLLSPGDSCCGMVCDDNQAILVGPLSQTFQNECWVAIDQAGSNAGSLLAVGGPPFDFGWSLAGDSLVITPDGNHFIGKSMAILGQTVGDRIRFCLSSNYPAVNSANATAFVIMSLFSNSNGAAQEEPSFSFGNNAIGTNGEFDRFPGTGDLITLTGNAGGNDLKIEATRTSAGFARVVGTLNGTTAIDEVLPWEASFKTAVPMATVNVVDGNPNLDQFEITQWEVEVDNA